MNKLDNYRTHLVKDIKSPCHPDAGTYRREDRLSRLCLNPVPNQHYPPLIRQQDPGREEKVVFLWPLAYHAGQALEFRPPRLPRWGSSRQVMKKNRSDNTRRRKRDMKENHAPDSMRANRRVSKERDSTLQYRKFLFF